MPKTVEYYSLNKAADKCGIPRQEFRKFVGEFEKQTATYLPKTEEGGKQIPEDVLQIFQRAAMWAQLEGCSPAVGMVTALEAGQQYRLQELAQAVANTGEFLKLPGELRRIVYELDQLSKRPRPVDVILKDSKDIARALAGIPLWQGVVCTLFGAIIGIILTHRFGW
ncbi:hypothetical protein [Deinococcus aquatilis]|uniref:hypothetical protein n=1 Tax=Deinococcus aquatilis TaxID=519440 RepID=UPI00036CE7C5|nr:hypothetical protein [Deinococcus aquatilis]